MNMSFQSIDKYFACLDVCLFVCVVSNKRQNPQIFCLFLFYYVYKENMLTIEIEDGLKAP